MIYTVVAIWREAENRFADAIEADTPEEAIIGIRAAFEEQEADELLVAGVFEGGLKCVDGGSYPWEDF